MSKQSEKVLFLALSGIGNLIMQLPTIKAYKAARPKSEITVWVAPRGTKILAENEPTIDHVIEAPIQQSILKHLKHTWFLTRQNFNLGIVLSPGQHWKSAAYLFLSGIPNRLGYTYPFRSNSASHFLLTNALGEKENLHDLEQNLNLLQLLNISVKSEPYQIPLSAHPQKSDQLTIGLHLGSSSDMQFKRWPLEYFIQLGQMLSHKHRAKLLLFGGPEEIKLKQSANQQLNNSQIVSENLIKTAEVISSCHLFIASDTGLMHISAATGTPTLGLFGPTDEKLTGPRGSKTYTLRAPNSRSEFNTETNFDLGQKTHSTLHKLTPDSVYNFILANNLI